MENKVFSKYYGSALWGFILLLVGMAFVMAGRQLQNPLGSVSPYTEVNDILDREPLVSFVIEQPIDAADVRSIYVTIRNDAPDGVVAPESGIEHEWVLEILADGSWHSMRMEPRNGRKRITWEFPAEGDSGSSGPSGIVMWGGGEQTYICNLAAYYKTPLEAGTYRIVFPAMEKATGSGGTWRSPLAMEFEVQP